MTAQPDGVRNKPPGTIKIIGIGQSLRGDDAAGLAAVRYWQAQYKSQSERPNLQVELAEIPGIELLSSLECISYAILVDAVRSGAKSGTIHILTLDQLEAYKEEASSAHGWGVAETLSLGLKLSPSTMPDHLLLIAIEAGDVSMGESLSPEVELAIPEAARMIEQLLPH